MLNRAQILAHRGLWLPDKLNQNSLNALMVAVKEGFGIETDLRNYYSDIVLRHDFPDRNNNYLFLRDFVSLMNDYQPTTLALNIKTDGLQIALKEVLTKVRKAHYVFVFDWSVPDGVGWAKTNLKLFTRLSEYEQSPILLDKSHGLWIDCFQYDFAHFQLLLQHQSLDKFCFVSPELHGRDPVLFWTNLRRFLKTNEPMLQKTTICTDYPFEVLKFFQG